MAENTISFDEMIKGYDLSPAELDLVKAENAHEAFTPDRLKSFVAQMRAEATAKKDGIDISADELHTAWETVKDAQDGKLKDIKEELQKKSEERMNDVDLENPDMATAVGFKEWLDINNSRDDLTDEQRARNQKIGAVLEAYMQQEDKETGLDRLTPENADEVAALQKELAEKYKDFNPFQMNEKGEMNDPLFKKALVFYSNMSIVDEDGKEISKDEREQILKQSVETAKSEAIQQLALDPEYKKAEDKDKYFRETMAGYLEQGAVSIISAEASQKIAEELGPDVKLSPKVQEEMRKKIEENFEKHAKNIGQRFTIGKDSVLAAQNSQMQHIANIQNRSAQKTSKWSLFKKPQFIKNFEAKHPKMAKTLKIVGTIGLSAGVAMTAGSAGMAVLGAYRGYKATREAWKKYKQEGKENNFLSYLWHNKRDLTKIASATAGALLAGYGAVEIGGAANGMLGNMLGSGGSEGAAEVAQKMVQQRFGRMIIGVSTAVSTFGSDVSDALKQTKGQGWKAKLKAVGKSALKAIGKTAVTLGGYELGQHFSGHNVAEHSSGTGNYDLNKSFTENLEDNQFKPAPLPGTEEIAGDIKGFDDIFSKGSEAEHNFKGCCDRAPTLVIEDLKAKGILEDDYRLTSSDNLKDDIRAYYEKHPESSKELTEYFNKDNLNRCTIAMEDYNAEMAARRAAAEARRKAAEEAAKEAAPDLEEVITTIEENKESVTLETPDPKVFEGKEGDFYDKQLNALETKGDSSLKTLLKAARKDPEVSLEQASKDFVGLKQEYAGMTQEEAVSLKKLIDDRLDAQDGNYDGTINDDEISKRDINRALKESKEILGVMKENADAIKNVRNVENIVGADVMAEAPTARLDTFQDDTTNPEFYTNLSKVLGGMKNTTDEETFKALLATKHAEGSLSSEQTLMALQRYGELAESGMKHGKILETMQEQNEKIATYVRAQQRDLYGQGEEFTEVNEQAPTQQGQASAQQVEPSEENAKSEEISKSQTLSQEAKDRINASQRDFEQQLDARIDEAATIPLEKAENLQSNQVLMGKDKLGNMQIVGKDENGNAFKVTVIHDYGKDVQTTGTFYKVEFPENSPIPAELEKSMVENDPHHNLKERIRNMGKEMNMPENGMDKEFDAFRQHMDKSEQDSTFVNSVISKIKNGIYHQVDSKGHAISATNTTSRNI